MVWNWAWLPCKVSFKIYIYDFWAAIFLLFFFFSRFSHLNEKVRLITGVDIISGPGNIFTIRVLGLFHIMGKQS